MMYDVFNFFCHWIPRGQRPIGGNQDWQHFPASGAPAPALNLPTQARPAPCPQRCCGGKVLWTQAQVWTIQMNPNVTPPPYVVIFPIFYKYSTIINATINVTCFHIYLSAIEMPHLDEAIYRVTFPAANVFVSHPKWQSVD